MEKFCNKCKSPCECMTGNQLAVFTCPSHSRDYNWDGFYFAEPADRSPYGVKCEHCFCTINSSQPCEGCGPPAPSSPPPSPSSTFSPPSSRSYPSPPTSPHLPTSPSPIMSPAEPPSSPSSPRPPSPPSSPHLPTSPCIPSPCKQSPPWPF